MGLACAATMVGCTEHAAYYREVVMAEDAVVRLEGGDVDSRWSAARTAMAELRVCEGALSDWQRSSECRQLPELAAHAVRVSPLLASAIEQALDVARRTDGFFDPTIGPAVALWRASAARTPPTVPAAASLDAAMARVGWRHVQLDAASLDLSFDREGVRLDFGGLGKGFAAARASTLLTERGFPANAVGVGGDWACGPGPFEDPRGWKVIRHDGVQPDVTAWLMNESISTSGDLSQCVEIGGVRYSHLLDPRTGQALTTCASACVRGPVGGVCDALATALCVAGPRDAPSVMKRFPGYRASVHAIEADRPVAWSTIPGPEGLPCPPDAVVVPQTLPPATLLPPATSVATVADDGTTLTWLDTGDSQWDVRDCISPEPDAGRIKVTRRWAWLGDQLSPPVVLGVRVRINRTGLSSAVIPGVLYHGNPSGRAAREHGGGGVVPEWQGRPNDTLRVEEHRAPAPFVSIEWDACAPSNDAHSADGNAIASASPHAWRVSALHTLPSPVPYAARPDLWWSLGLAASRTDTELQLLSGPVSINGRDGFIKSGQGALTEYPNAFLRVPPHGVIEKTFWLQESALSEQGTGFQSALRASIDLNGPCSADGLPTLREITRSKIAFARSRWNGANAQPGFAMYPNHPNLYVMGWAGQADAPGYALQVLGESLGDPTLSTMARQSLDTLAAAPFNDEGFFLAFDASTGAWTGQDHVSQGQAMSSFARAIRVGRARGVDTAAWERFLRRACEVHAARFLARAWNEADQPRSTAEAFLINPLCLTSQLLNEPRFLEAARRAGTHYWNRHRTMEEPYWGGTLDARCEDKEGAWAAFEAFLALYEATSDQDAAQKATWLTAATHAAEVCLTYTFLWDVDLPAGRLRDHDLHTRGWTSVSVQNMHLDVYGVVYSPQLWRLGQILGRPELQSIAELMFRSCGQMIDEAGSQGEQLQQTNFAQAGDLSNPDRFRGGYVEHWTVFWIDAHFLTAAAAFEEMHAFAK